MMTKNRRGESLVTVPGASGGLQGKVLAPEGPTKAALVVTHGRQGHMDEPLVAGLAWIGAALGLWTLRFTFAYQAAGREPSAGHEEEIADLRAAIDHARRTSGHDRVILAGRGLGAWAAIAAATDESAEDVVLMGLSYTGQPERRTALRRLGEFEIAALIVVGSRSDRLDLPALREALAGMPSVWLEVVEGANHRLQDERLESMTEAALGPSKEWLRARLE